MPSACWAAVRKTRFFQARVRARERLQRGALREPAGPRRRAAVEAEEVLPRDAPRTLGGEGDRFFEHLAQLRVLVPLVVVAVGLAEGRQPLDLDPLPGVVLPHQPAARNAHVLVGARQRFVAPPLDVAFERQHQRGQPRGDQLAGRGDLLHVGDHAAQFGAARAAQVLDGVQRVGVRRGVFAVGFGAQAPAALEALQRSVHRRPPRLGSCGWGKGKQESAQQQPAGEPLHRGSSSASVRCTSVSTSSASSPWRRRRSLRARTS